MASPQYLLQVVDRMCYWDEGDPAKLMVVKTTHCEHVCDQWTYFLDLAFTVACMIVGIVTLYEKQIHNTYSMTHKLYVNLSFEFQVVRQKLP